MKLKPTADNIVLKQTEAEETTASGIILAGVEYKFVKLEDVLAVVTD